MAQSECNVYNTTEWETRSVLLSLWRSGFLRSDILIKVCYSQKTLGIAFQADGTHGTGMVSVADQEEVMGREHASEDTDGLGRGACNAVCKS